MKIRILSIAFLALGACAPAVPSAPPSPPGSPEAPELGISESRPIEGLHRRTIGFLEEGVWISNEIEGGRVSDAWLEGDSLFVIQIRPENAPVNNSAWYAFKVWSRDDRTLDLRLVYEDGDHRYWPKVRRAGEDWAAMDSAAVRVDSVAEETTLRLRVGRDTVWVAGQEMMTSGSFDAWTAELASESQVRRRVIGRSGRGRPIQMLEFGAPEAARHVMIIGRQHPPEATGTMALMAFVEELAGNTLLAREFRDRFRVHVVPLVNPDGLDLGHWRHNTGGVDLNRDWEAFNQPETRVVREAFTEILDQPGHELWFAVDFHSTRYDVFYTLERDLETNPPGVTDRWLEFISTRLPHYEVNDSPSGLRTPMSRNWFYRAFGAPALIYEVGDRTDRDLIREVATTAARGTMEILLEEIGRR